MKIVKKIKIGDISGIWKEDGLHLDMQYQVIEVEEKEDDDNVRKNEENG